MYENEEEALLVKEEIEFFSGREVHFFPIKKNRIFEKDDELKRIGFFFKFYRDFTSIGLFPEEEVTQAVILPEEIGSLLFEVKVGDSVYQEDLLNFLIEGGYSQTSLVRERGEFSKRGGILDIFSPNYDEPVRIEFMGDDVISIRFFDPHSQRSKKHIDKAELLDLRYEVKKVGSILSYLDAGSLIVHNGLHEKLKIRGDLSLFKKWNETVNHCLSLDLSGLTEEYSEVIRATSNEDIKAVFNAKKNEVFKILVEMMKNEWRNVPCVYIVANSEHQAHRLREILINYGIFLPCVEKPSFDPQLREWAITYGTLRRGFRTDSIVVIAEDELLGPKRRTVKVKSQALDEFVESFKELSYGDYVVHIDYGIGIFRGTKELKIDGCVKDFLVIEYEGGDKLYVPTHDLHLVQKYIATEKAKPKIDRLGSTRWAYTKAKVRKKIEDMAQELIEIYAERRCREGFAFSEEDEIYKEMESKFQYEETEGQKRAIEEVLSDMKSPRPMDRLLCGDAGFGKTEVALRAAFKAVMDNKQVAVLVPTTVLAEQHYKTFTERLKEYPVNIEVLSRFKSQEEQKEIIERLKKGTIDIVIGTHRILQKDVEFRDLGLLIIDEEHKFGVKHKEKLRSIKKTVDVLTLSATPIPRTLYMALMGIKDLSIIDTPPLDRLAIKTYVTKFDDEIIKRGVLRELERNGQVFFVHNYIYNIDKVKDHLQKLLPEVRIAIAHGKMKESHLEKVMLDFIDRKYDLLLSTNIVESGLDITNANTIFINNAHRMGLSELYQLRGRVGRGPRQAYAYLLIPSGEILTKDAMLRLKIIEEMSHVGSGFQIANYDLEIRGCGNLLGKEQSGNVNSIGFELFVSMLEEAIKRLSKKEVAEEDIIPEISLPIEAYIPDSYVEDPSQKLLLYKRLARIKTETELQDIESEIVDRYGKMPEPVKNLLKIIEFRLFLSKARIKKVEKTDKGLFIYLTEKTPINTEKLIECAMRDGLKLMSDRRIFVPLAGKFSEITEFARNVLLKVLSL
ncbi:MAG: transcription-repair coupling factor [Desulfobacterota bacterium]|nr:transcription-repair coupling factor [Thermodesulfobacteriota bacterium]MDW8001287.1 transcription-repair coupling factor [Deltaproteobacteria bacterium]